MSVSSPVRSRKNSLSVTVCLKSSSTTFISVNQLHSAAHPQGQERGAAGQRAENLHLNLSGPLSSFEMNFPCASPGPGSLPSSAALGSIPSPPQLPFLPLEIPLQPSRLKTTPPLTAKASWIFLQTAQVAVPQGGSKYWRTSTSGALVGQDTPQLSVAIRLSGAPSLKGNPWRSLKWHVAWTAFNGWDFKLVFLLFLGDQTVSLFEFLTAPGLAPLSCVSGWNTFRCK